MWGPPPLLLNGYRGGRGGVKWSKCEVNHLPASGASVKNVWRYTFATQTHLLGMQSGNFTFTGRLLFWHKIT